jgi:hypothetical protein
MTRSIRTEISACDAQFQVLSDVSPFQTALATHQFFSGW